MKAYTRRERHGARVYPAILATDEPARHRVFFTEPAKWVARLRRRSATEARPILLRTEMAAGHGGRSGRYAAWGRSRGWSVVLDQLGATETL